MIGAYTKVNIKHDILTEVISISVHRSSVPCDMVILLQPPVGNVHYSRQKPDLLPAGLICVHINRFITASSILQ